jgi:hypothetical protein
MLRTVDFLVGMLATTLAVAFFLHADVVLLCWYYTRGREQESADRRPP